MHIKRFQAQDINKALEKVKEEFGEDAIILKTNRIKKRDPYTNNSESFVEILAAIDYENDNKNNDCINNLIEKNDLIESNLKNNTNICNNSNHEKNFSFNEYKSIIKNDSKIDISNQSSLLMLYQIFSNFGIKSNYHNELTLRFLSDNSNSNNIDCDYIYNWLINLLKKELILSENSFINNKPLIITIIGPTGSGKTLTTAKLAAELKFSHKKNGLLISLDNYKLGAIEHLKRYASIMDINFSIAKNSSNLYEIIKENTDKDYIIIDTFGKSIYDENYYNELIEIFNTVPNIIKGLAILPSNCSNDVLNNYINFYSRFPILGWIITKIDEINDIISLLLICRNNNLKICYLSDGQKIPDNLIKANLKNLNSIIERFNKKNNLITENEILFNSNSIKKEKSKLQILREIQV